MKYVLQFSIVMLFIRRLNRFISLTIDCTCIIGTCKRSQFYPGLGNPHNKAMYYKATGEIL